MTAIDTKGLSILTNEALALSNKRSLTRVEERRLSTLMGSISAIKAGASLAEVDQEMFNEAEARNGFKPTKIKRMSEKRMAKAAFMQQLFHCNGTKGVEFRDESEGNLTTALGTYSSLGHFVPTDFYKDVFAAMGEHDALFDEDVVTVINSDNAHPLQIGTYDDLANVAVQVGEAVDLTGDQVNLGNPDQVVVGAYSFRSPIHKFSLEVFQDLEASYTAYVLFQKFAADRCARGIGKVLLTGSGTGATKGLITALAASGVSPIVATGSATNSGGAETGVNSIGSTDLGKLFYSVNRVWRESSKAGWLMNDSTLQYLATVVTKQGLPLVNFRDGIPTILGKKVCVSPSMESIGSSEVPVIFGALDQWVTRLVSDDLTRIRVLKETYIDKGQIGLQYFMRCDGVLAFNGTGADCPMNYIQNHS